MALVDGDDVISDDSSFYGDEETKAEWDEKAHRPIEPPPTNSYTRLLARKFEFDVSQVQQNSKVIAVPKRDEPPTETKSAPRKRHDDEAADLSNWASRSKINPSIRQANESVEDFLHRAPVLAAETAKLGPWLWVRNPNASPSTAQVDAFVATATELLESFKAQKIEIEQQNPEKTPYTITRLLKPHRERSEDKILAQAVETGTTCGKWMLFSSSKALPNDWKLVAQATADGTLGPVSKVATPSPSATKDETLICVYTEDFRDRRDVWRVLDQLLRIGVATRDRPMYYKCDAYTYLGINSDNVYKIRASLYSSKDLLAAGPHGAVMDGPLGRMQSQAA